MTDRDGSPISRPIHCESSERWLWTGPDFAIGRIVVGADDPSWESLCCTGSEPALAFHATSWVVESPRVPAFVAGPNRIVFVTANAEYRRRRPPGLAECSDALWVSRSVRRDVIGEFMPDVEERMDDPFPCSAAPRPPHVSLLHRALMAYLFAEERPDPLLVEETALHLFRESNRIAHGGRASDRSAPRPRTRSAHCDAVRAAEEIMASSYREPLRLGKLARRVGLSPAHFSRVFRRETGSTVHGYVTALRLAEALDRLPESRGDTTTLALELGFSSRSHFSDAFRNRFGVSPSSAAHTLAGPGAGDLRRLLSSRPK
jgi:AraC family transcriptional regulator